MDKITMKNILEKTYADLSANVRDYKTKLERLECQHILHAAASLEYHYSCIRDNLHQIEYHLQEIENQCKQLDEEAVVSSSNISETTPTCSPEVQERSRDFKSMSRILTPSFIQTFAEFDEVSDSLQPTRGRKVFSSNVENKPKEPSKNKGSPSNQNQPTSWNETML